MPYSMLKTGKGDSDDVLVSVHVWEQVTLLLISQSNPLSQCDIIRTLFHNSDVNSCVVQKCYTTMIESKEEKIVNPSQLLSHNLS